MFTAISYPPSPSQPCYPTPNQYEANQHEGVDACKEKITRDMSLEHQLLSLSLGDDDPQEIHDQQQPFTFVHSPHDSPYYAVHPLDKVDLPKYEHHPIKDKDKVVSTGRKSNKNGKTKGNGPLAALSKRFSPSLPPRSLSTPAASTLTSFAAAMTAEPGFNGATLLSADSRLGSESVDAVEPLPGPFRDHIRHHSVSGLPSQDSKGSRSSCTSSCSASSASSSLTSSTSSSLSCSATSSSSSSSPFFSPSEFYNSLFGNSHGNSDIGNSNSSNHNYDHSIDPLSSAPSPSLSSSLSTLNPPIIVTTTTKPTTMGGARQIRSGSWTSSFSLSSLSIPKNSTRAATPDTLSPIGSRSPESYPLPSAGTQTRSNPQPSISQYSNPVSPTGTFPPCSSSSTSTSPPCAFSPMSLPPLPLFVSLSPTTGSALHSSNSLLSIVQGDDHPSTPHSIVTMGAPLTIAFQSNDLGGMVTATEARAMSGNAHPQTYAQQHPCAVHTPPQDHHGAQSFEAGANRLEMCLPSRSNSSAPVVGARSLAPPTSFKSSSCNSEPGFTSGSRRSSKDSLDSVPGVTLDDLVDQLTIPDYVNTLEQIARTKVFLLIYRKFLRPRELLEMFISRFEDLGEFIDDDDEEARNTRLRVCACIYYWLKHHPNDLIHRQTRQRVASFLRERVALFPCLNEIYVKLLPLSSIHYFNSWRWTYSNNSPNSRSSSISGSSFGSGSVIMDDDSDSGFCDTAAAAGSRGGALCGHEMDEDCEWGLFDEDEALPETKKSMSMDSIAPFAPFPPPTHGFSHSRTPSRFSFSSLPRDRRSSTGSLIHSSPCDMDSFVASRRGSASSASSGPLGPTGPGHNGTLNLPACVHAPTSFAEGDMTPLQLQPMGSIPFINKRISSQAYRQKVTSYGNANTGSNTALVFRDNAEEVSMHPLQRRSSPVPPPIDYLPMNTPFIEIKDAAIAAQLTCVEFGLFRKLKPRDMLRQVWKTNKGSASFQACIAHFNFISSWVGTMILSPSKVKNRAKMMEKFINIARILRGMGNFNTTMAIIGAMNTSSIHRLVQTRELLQGKDVWTTFKELEHLMSSERSFYEYRQALKAQKLPCIPYLGVHLGDLLSISEGNRDFRQDGTIHWQKFCLLTEVISTVMHFHTESYGIQPDPFISRVITDTHVLDDEELYTKSVGTEPGKLHHSRSLSKFNFF